MNKPNFSILMTDCGIGLDPLSCLESLDTEFYAMVTRCYAACHKWQEDFIYKRLQKPDEFCSSRLMIN